VPTEGDPLAAAGRNSRAIGSGTTQRPRAARRRSSGRRRRGVAKAREHWQRDNDLAGIRDDAELVKLSETERVAFCKLRADVDALLKASRMVDSTHT
jgi:hypothetical protein